MGIAIFCDLRGLAVCGKLDSIALRQLRLSERSIFGCEVGARRLKKARARIGLPAEIVVTGTRLLFGFVEVPLTQ